MPCDIYADSYVSVSIEAISAIEDLIPSWSKSTTTLLMESRINREILSRSRITTLVSGDSPCAGS